MIAVLKLLHVVTAGISGLFALDGKLVGAAIPGILAAFLAFQVKHSISCGSSISGETQHLLWQPVTDGGSRIELERSPRRGANFMYPADT